MPAEFQFACPLPNGLHARPATALAEQAARWRSSITLTNLRTKAVANAASVLELVACGVMAGDQCFLDCRGADEAIACRDIARFIAEELPALDEHPPVETQPARGRIPRTLAVTGEGVFVASPASPGIGRGKLVLAGGLSLPDDVDDGSTKDEDSELAAARHALDAVQAEMQQRFAEEKNRQAREVCRALLALLADPALYRSIATEIHERQASARRAIVSAVHGYSRKLLDSGSAYLRERCADLEEIGAMLLAKLPGAPVREQDITLVEPSILVARSLGPSQLLALDRKMLAGIVLETAGTTAHVVILARSFGIPCTTGADWFGRLEGGGQAVIEGSFGLLATPVTAEVQRFYELECELAERIASRHAEELAQLSPENNLKVEIAANIASAEEIGAALANGAEGIGLFRTEMLFTSAAEESDEDAQFAIYSRAAEELAGRTLIVRTLDIGGDKPLPYLGLPREDNPFLGCRGIRVYRQHPELLRRQLRAIARASAKGRVWVMAPMVSGLEEASWFREQVQDVQRELATKGVPFDPGMPIGIMIEVPSAALAVGQLSQVADFFSVGTNDLTQYLLAVERGNPAVGNLYDELHPALIRLLGIIVEEAHAYGKWVGLCGELARNPSCAPLLVGLGFDELSMSAPAIPAVRAALASAGADQCRQAANRVLKCRDSSEVRAELLLFETGNDRPLLDRDLIAVGSDCRSKAEAIRELCAMSYIARRCSGVNELEEAIWEREATYSTGLGYGFAIPHCKSGAVTAGSLAVLKLARPIDWGSLDGEPVGIVLMLTMPADDPANRHLKVFAALSRKLMHEEFRRGLIENSDPNSILTYLQTELTTGETKGSNDA